MNSSVPESVLTTGSAGVAAADAGREAAGRFERAAAEHRRFLLQIAVASTRNVADAEDIVQEALLRAHRGLKNFRGDCPLRIWLARIVVRVAINHRRSFLRNVQRWIRFSDLRDARDEPAEAFDAADPRSLQAPRELMVDLERHVQRLPEEFRLPLLMLAVEGLTIPEIAGILEIPEGTVKSRIFYGRRKLKQSLKL